MLHNLQGEFSILKQRCSTSNQRPNTIHISQQRCHDSQVINAWILHVHVQPTHHNISKISLLSKFCVKLALQSIYSSHQDSWQCVVQCSSLLPHIQQLNFQLQIMIECPFQYYGILYIISINPQINPMVAISDIIFSHILNSPNRFFQHHFLTWFLDPVYACCDLSDCIRSGSCGSVRVFYMELPELLVESAIQV